MPFIAMDPHPPRPSPADDTSAQWHALVDGQLPPAEASALRKRLKDDAAAQDTVDRWHQQRTQLRALHADLLHAPVPDALLQAALHAADRRVQQHAQWWRWGGMAASVLAAFTLGWMGHGHWAGGHPAGATLVRGAAPVQHFAHQAAVAHAVYQPEVRHPVEVTAAQQEHLVQWLSKRLNRPLKVPALAAQGYELVGGRLLPGDSGARAQFMYQNSTGQRITLYLGALAPAAGAPGADQGQAPASPHAAATATAFQFTQEGPVPGFYWVDQGFGYALSGQLSRAELLALATVVYQQLQLP